MVAIKFFPTEIQLKKNQNEYIVNYDAFHIKILLLFQNKIYKIDITLQSNGFQANLSVEIR